MENELRGAAYYEALTAGAQPPIDGVSRFGIWHEESGNPMPPLIDNRPLSWDNDPEHDGPLGGLRMPACEDQPWDDAVDDSTTPILHVTKHAGSGNVDPFAAMTILTVQDSVCTPDGEHKSVARSSLIGESCMPDAAISGSAAADAAAAHVYEAYVAAFCALDQP